MSSKMSKSDAIPSSKMVTKLKMEEKRSSRLVRTSSIEKIKRFNSYICSQHYIMLPALISCLKSSQVNVLHTQYEQKIHDFKSMIFSTYFYKFFLQTFKFYSKKPTPVTKQQRQQQSSLISNFYATFSNTFESTFVLKISVHLTSLFIFTQLCYCIYLLALIHVPNGLYFLIICLFYINYLGYTIYSSCKHDKKLL